MKFLTTPQPHATLIAVGTQTVETRPFSTKYRGPLAIHAGLAKPSGIGKVGENFIARTKPGPWFIYQRPEVGGPMTEVYPLPLGALVAVCDLVDVVPIASHDTCVQYPAPGSRYFETSSGPLELYQWNPEPGGCSDIAGWQSIGHEFVDGGERGDQLPYGDFTPGRFAWILGNVRPIEPVPMKGTQGLRDLPADIAEQIEVLS